MSAQARDKRIHLALRVVVFDHVTAIRFAEGFIEPGQEVGELVPLAHWQISGGAVQLVGCNGFRLHALYSSTSSPAQVHLGGPALSGRAYPYLAIVSVGAARWASSTPRHATGRRRARPHVQRR